MCYAVQLLSLSGTCSLGRLGKSDSVLPVLCEVGQEAGAPTSGTHSPSLRRQAADVGVD